MPKHNKDKTQEIQEVEKYRPGRKGHSFSEEERNLVIKMAAVGVPLQQIADSLKDGIDVETLNRHFKKEISEARAKANANIGETLYNKAMNGDTTALIWWSKVQMKWKSEENIRISGDSENPVQIQQQIVKIDPRDLDENQVDLIKSIINRKMIDINPNDG